MKSFPSTWPYPPRLLVQLSSNKRQHFSKTSWLNTTKEVDGHLILILTRWIDNQGCLWALDPHPKLSPIYGMDRKSRMPTGTYSSSETKSYLWDGPTIKEANGHLILILTGLIDVLKHQRAPNPHSKLSLPTYEWADELSHQRVPWSKI